MKSLQILFSNIKCSEKVLSSWGGIDCCCYFKKSSRNERANRRGTSLMLILSKLLASVISRSLYNVREEQTGEKQAGFRINRGWID